MSLDPKKRAPSRGGPVEAADEDLASWLCTLWTRETPPDAVAVWQLFQPSRPARGEQILKRNFKPGERLDAEGAAKLANEIVAAAQNDADSSRRERLFQIEVVDKNRADSVVRLLGPVHPKRLYLKSGQQGEEDDDAEGRGGLPAKYAAALLSQMERDRAQLDKATGDLLQMQSQMIVSLHTSVDTLMSKVIDLHDRYQQARDQEVERRARAEWLALKSSLMRDGLRTARNFLTGAVGDDQDPGPASGGAAPPPPPPRTSKERILVDNFLVDCDETGIGVKMFGSWEKGPDGRPRLVAEGIFTEQQFRLLQGVRAGRLPPAELDKLLPSSGDPLAITDEQMAAAAAVMTSGVTSSLMELVRLRQAAAAAAAAKQEG